LSEQPYLYGDVSTEATSLASYLEINWKLRIPLTNEIVKAAAEDLRI
jgi:hypothetical protein